MSTFDIFLCRKKGWHKFYVDDWPSGDECIPITHEKLCEETTLEELADFCDNQAQSSNNREFVGSHRILAALLHQQLGREQATHLLFEITRRGGLDGMNGVGNKIDSYAEFGLPEPWNNWNLPA